MSPLRSRRRGRDMGRRGAEGREKRRGNFSLFFIGNMTNLHVLDVQSSKWPLIFTRCVVLQTFLVIGCGELIKSFEFFFGWDHLSLFSHYGYVEIIWFLMVKVLIPMYTFAPFVVVSSETCL